MTDRVHKLLMEYTSKHRPKPQEGCEEYVFLTPQGRQVTHISDDLVALSKSFPTSLGVISVTATDMRKFTATHVAKDGATPETIRTVATHMTHSEDTAKRYYQHLQGADESVEAFSVMSRKRPPTEEDLPIVPRLKKARRKWNGPEEDTLKEHFSLATGHEFCL